MTTDYRLRALENPTAVLQELHRAHSTSDNFPRSISQHFQSLFSNENTFRKIPSLDVKRPPEVHHDRALVRFRAMVQDTSLSTEMYLSRFPDGSCGGWGIYGTESGGSSSPQVDYANLQECSVLWATSVPAESNWCATELDGPIPDDTQSNSASEFVLRRAHKYPHTEFNHVGVQVKIYDKGDIETFKSTDVVTFVGILSTESCSLDQTGTGSPSDAPTLHVLFTRSHTPTIISRPFPRLERIVLEPHAISADSTQLSERLAQDNSQVREQLISWIADEALGGDRVVAEWVLLSCIARVQSRHPPLLPPSLTVSRFPPPPTTPSNAPTRPLPLPTLSTILRLLLPLTHTLPLSLDALNKSRFTPESKDEDLHSGILQVPQGTVLLISEGGVGEGQLLERGVMNVRALQDVMKGQTLPYIFPFSQFSFPTDIGCIVLSEGRKSTFFKTDLNVPLTAPTTTSGIARLYKPPNEVVLPSADKLAIFRDLVVGARCGKVQVAETTSEHIQSEFVRERQGNRSLTADDLIRWMTVSKLYALSLHEPSLSVETWQRAKAFDDQRRVSVA
ncbi:mini-chromosome maintenance replisome factor-domain-containing protein [Trametes meyenii]|nr:mini-chromosome maintenance replisome factor-domain-containing protein [Trametes meyenii]